MSKTNINLISTLSEDTWFYKLHEEELKPHIGKPYLSYSTAGSYLDYTEDFIKQKLVGIDLPSTVYTRLGNFLGEAVENGFWGDNPDNFGGLENIDLDELRPEGAEYEKLVVIDFGEWIFIGFIDRYQKTEDGVEIIDFKSGAMNKKQQYLEEDYTQVMLYAHARESAGDKIKSTGVYFIERVGSHIKPPLCLSKNQEYLPLEYNKKRVKFALDKLDKAVKGISELNTTYQKYFK